MSRARKAKKGTEARRCNGEENPGCRNFAIPLRRKCCACASKKYRRTYPIKYAFDTIRRHARRRRKEFTITLEWFTQWCAETDYIARKGRTNDALTIERKDNRIGYVPGNLTTLTMAENRHKWFEVDRYAPEPQPPDNYPF